MIGDHLQIIKLPVKGKVTNGLFGQLNTTNYSLFSIQVAKIRSIV